MEYGYLYCAQCGMEIQIVPDFEPEIENSITETLSTVAEEIEEGREPSTTTQEPEKKRNRRIRYSFFSEEQGKGNWLMLCLITFIVVTLTAAFVSVYM